MAIVGKILGVRTVVGNLRRKDRAYARGIARGLKLGGLLIQRGAQQRVPVEFGHLKASAFTRAFGTGFETKVTTGFTALYAAFVHERVGMTWKGLPRVPNPPHKGRYWDPQGKGQAKFLENTITIERKNVIQVVRDEAFKAKWE